MRGRVGVTFDSQQEVPLAEDVIPQVRSVIINTTDVERLAAFWSELLAVEVAHRSHGFLWLRPQRPGSFSIAFQEVSQPTEGRRRLHLDTSVPDLESATARILSIGGSHVEDHQIPEFSWRVMADPDGNEFCIAVESH
jgi:predicted enzyme related to lactoylglutathione lyase